MAHRKADTDRRWNNYFALSQLRKRGGKRCPSHRGSRTPTPTPPTVLFGVVEDEGSLANERLDP